MNKMVIFLFCFIIPFILNNDCTNYDFEEPEKAEDCLNLPTIQKDFVCCFLHSKTSDFSYCVEVDEKQISSYERNDEKSEVICPSGNETETDSQDSHCGKYKVGLIFIIIFLIF